MGKRIRINGKLYESVSPRNRSRRLNEAKWHEAKKPYYYSIGDWEDLPDGSAARTFDTSQRLDINVTLGGTDEHDIQLNISTIDEQDNDYGFYKTYDNNQLDRAEREFEDVIDEIDSGTLMHIVARNHGMKSYF